MYVLYFENIQESSKINGNVYFENIWIHNFLYRSTLGLKFHFSMSFSKLSSYVVYVICNQEKAIKPFSLGEKKDYLPNVCSSFFKRL